MKITITQKRFLIIWVLFHSFAFFFNIFEIDGALKNYNYSPVFNIFNTHRQYGNRSDFWPFTTMQANGATLLPDGPNDDPWIFKNMSTYSWNFYGVFNSYDTPEYVFYILMAFGLVFIPKLWQEEKAVDNIKNI